MWIPPQICVTRSQGSGEIVERVEYVVTIPSFYSQRVEVKTSRGQRLCHGCEQPQPSEFKSVHPWSCFLEDLKHLARTQITLASPCPLSSPYPPLWCTLNFLLQMCLFKICLMFHIMTLHSYRSGTHISYNGQNGMSASF